MTKTLTPEYAYVGVTTKNAHGTPVRIWTIYWQGTDPGQIPDAALARPAMIKGNHGSGFNLAYDGVSPGREEIEATLARFLSSTFGVELCEWAYALVPPVGFVEARLAKADGSAPDNLNVHCANGAVLFASIYRGDKTRRREIGFFDAEGLRLGFRMTQGADPLPQDFVPGESFHEAVARARVLSAEIDYARVDFMATEGGIWFNEITTYTASGHVRFDRPELVDARTQAWDLRRSWFVSTPQKGLREVYRRALARVLARG